MKLTLFYSARAVAMGHGTYWWRTLEGEVVEATIVIDLAVHPRSNFGWNDAVVVGEASSNLAFVRQGMPSPRKYPLL